MLPMAAGIGVLILTAVIFWRALPRDGKKYRFADTAWEPYVGVAITAGMALGLALTLSGAFSILGS